MTGDARTPAASPAAGPEELPSGALYTARLTIDITPALHGRIRLAACRRGATMAGLLRALLEREFPPDADEGAP
jgi:hypothetical protein